MNSPKRADEILENQGLCTWLYCILLIGMILAQVAHIVQATKKTGSRKSRMRLLAFVDLTIIHARSFSRSVGKSNGFNNKVMIFF